MLNIKLLFFTFIFYVLNNIVIGWLAYDYGYKDAMTTVANENNKELNKKFSILETQNEIENAPIDIAVTVRRLHNGTF